MPIMKDKFVQDFLKIDAVDTAILSFQLQLSVGVKILDSLIPKVEMDIRILDEKKYKELREKIEGYTKEFDVEATDIRTKHEEKETTNDPFEDDNLKNKLNNLKHSKQQKIIADIQNIGYRSGWLD